MGLGGFCCEGVELHEHGNKLESVTDLTETQETLQAIGIVGFWNILNTKGLQNQHHHSDHEHPSSALPILWALHLGAAMDLLAFSICLCIVEFYIIRGTYCMHCIHCYAGFSCSKIYWSSSWHILTMVILFIIENVFDKDISQFYPFICYFQIFSITKSAWICVNISLNEHVLLFLPIV